MSAPALAVVSGRSPIWRDLYLKAIFETKPEIIPVRIREAEKALVFRAHELFGVSHCLTEREAINATLHALHAFEACVKSRDLRKAA